MFSLIDRHVRKKIAQANNAPPAEQGKRYGLVIIVAAILALIFLPFLIILFTASMNAIFR